MRCFVWPQQDYSTISVTVHFSHVFDHQFIPSIQDQSGGVSWHHTVRHEDMNVLLIDDLFESNVIAIDDNDSLLIKA